MIPSAESTKGTVSPSVYDFYAHCLMCCLIVGNTALPQRYHFVHWVDETKVYQTGCMKLACQRRTTFEWLEKWLRLLTAADNSQAPFDHTGGADVKPLGRGFDINTWDTSWRPNAKKSNSHCTCSGCKERKKPIGTFHNWVTNNNLFDRDWKFLETKYFYCYFYFWYFFFFYLKP